MNGQRVLVTGTTGFVGSAVARHLLQVGYRVSALIRDTSRRDNIRNLDLDLHIGDLRDVDTLTAAMQDCAGVFHVAADYRLWTPDPDTLYANNVDGSRNIMMAAARAGIQRVVHTSSVATLGLTDDGTMADENTPVALDDMIGHYKRSKFLAEQAVMQATEETAMDVVIVHPAAPVGPNDIKPTPTGRMVVDAMHGRMPAFVDTGLDIVHVDDVALGHRLAYEHGTPGRHYILGGDNLDLQEILALVADMTGRRPPRLRIPHGVVLPAAHVSEWIARFTGKTPSLTVAGAKLARKPMYFTHRRATDELGYRPRPGRDALADAVAWFRAHAY